MNTSHDYQPQGYTSSTPVVDPYTRSPVGTEGGSGSISEQRVFLSNSMPDSSFLGQTPPHPQVHIGDQNAARIAQHVAPTLQQSHSSRGSASGREWEAPASHQPSHVRSGNAVPLHNIQEQHHYVHGVPGNYRYLPCLRIPALILNNSSSTSC